MVTIDNLICFWLACLLATLALSLYHAQSEMVTLLAMYTLYDRLLMVEAPTTLQCVLVMFSRRLHVSGTFWTYFGDQQVVQDRYQDRHKISKTKKTIQRGQISWHANIDTVLYSVCINVLNSLAISDDFLAASITAIIKKIM